MEATCSASRLPPLLSTSSTVADTFLTCAASWKSAAVVHIWMAAKPWCAEGLKAQ